MQFLLPNKQIRTRNLPCRARPAGCVFEASRGSGVPHRRKRLWSPRPPSVHPRFLVRVKAYSWKSPPEDLFQDNLAQTPPGSEVSDTGVPPEAEGHVILLRPVQVVLLGTLPPLRISVCRTHHEADAHSRRNEYTPDLHVLEDISLDDTERGGQPPHGLFKGDRSPPLPGVFGETVSIVLVGQDPEQGCGDSVTGFLEPPTMRTFTLPITWSIDRSSPGGHPWWNRCHRTVPSDSSDNEARRFSR